MENANDRVVLRQLLFTFTSRSHIRSFIVPQLRKFDQLFSDTVFPQFADPEQQADDAAQRYWDEQTSEAIGEDGCSDLDLNDLTNNSHEAGLAFYDRISAMHYTVLNLFAAGLFHLFEQQVAALCRRWTLPPSQHKPLKVLQNWLENSAHVDVTRSPSWSRVLELELVANVVKHGEGPSARRLREVNSDYFLHHIFREPIAEDTRAKALAQQVAAPLTGDDIYVTKNDYARFVDAVIKFWEWLADELDAGCKERRWRQDKRTNVKRC